MDKATNQPITKETAYQIQETITKTNQNIVEANTNQGIISNQEPPTYIRKKLIYNKFVKLVKKGGYTSARLIAKSLGVHKDTILEWSNTSKVKEALGMDISNYIQNIKKNKDWKASAYLLDKVLDDDGNTTNIQVNTLDGLTIIRR